MKKKIIINMGLIILGIILIFIGSYLIKDQGLDYSNNSFYIHFEYIFAYLPLSVVGIIVFTISFKNFYRLIEEYIDSKKNN